MYTVFAVIQVSSVTAVMKVMQVRQTQDMKEGGREGGGGGQGGMLSEVELQWKCTGKNSQKKFLLSNILYKVTVGLTFENFSRKNQLNTNCTVNVTRRL